MKKSAITLGIIILSSISGLFYYQHNLGLNENNILSFELNNAQGTINQTSGEIDVILPTGTPLSHIAPIFTTTTGTTLTVNKIQQYSGSSYQNFESNVPYIALSGSGNFKNYFVHVTTSTQHHDSYFTNFNIISNNNFIPGVISGNNINITVPSNYNLTSLISNFDYVGKSVKVESNIQVNNITINNFTSPVIYSVAAKDGTPANYTVSVSQYPPTSKNLTSFSLITNNGIYPCNISGLNITCGIPSTIPSSSLIALWSTSGSLVQIGSVTQVSGLTPNNFSSPVTYVVTSGDGNTTQNYTVTVNNNYILLEAQNITKTIFDNTTYDISFKLTNNSSATLPGLTDQITTHHPFVWTLGTDNCTGESLAVSESCVVTGTLTSPQSYGDSQVKFVATSSNGVQIPIYDKIITSIPQVLELESTTTNPQNYAAYTFYNQGSHRMFVTATVNGDNIQFDNNNIGSFSNCSTCFESYAVEMVKGNNTLYIPAYPAVGGKILISVDNKLPNGPTPSVTATSPSDTYYTRWQQVEYGGGLNGSNQPALFNLNPTNVDFVSLPTSISTSINGAVGVWFTNDDAVQGYVYAPFIRTQQVLSTMESQLANIPNASNPSWNGLTQLNAASTSILRILSPSSIFPFIDSPGNQFNFNSAFYTQYITDLWAYYTDNGGAHFLYVDDSPVASLVTPGSTCILQCQVTHVDNLMHCAYNSGTCPTNTSTGTLDGAYDIGGESSPAGMTKFTATDFISAAGTNAVTTFGLNGTYRSITGENIVAAQSIGFLPYCPNTSFIFGTNEFLTQLTQYYTPQYNCLTNYAQYTSSVIDQYSAVATQYMDYYNYGYSDTIGQSGAIYNNNNQLYGFSIDVNYQ